MADPTLPEARLRQLAILFAHIDAAAQQQLILHLPTPVAMRVRQLARNLRDVDPAEVRRVLEQFRQGVSRPSARQPAPPPAGDGNVDTPEGKAVANTPNTGSGEPASDGELRQNAQSPGDESEEEADLPAWTQLPPHRIIEFVRQERPTVIAVVVHQLPVRRAVQVLEQLPTELSCQVVALLAQMDTVDEQAKAEIDAYLREKLGRQREQEETSERTRKRMQQLLAAAPPYLREFWERATKTPVATEGADTSTVDHFYAGQFDRPEKEAADQEPTVGGENGHWGTPVVQPQSGAGPADSQVAHQPREQSTAIAGEQVPGDAASSPAAMASASAQSTAAPPQGDDLVGMPAAPDAGGPQVVSFPTGDAKAAEAVDQPPRRERELERLLDLPPTLLAQVLTAAGAETVLLALAGATPQFMKRFRRMLDRRDARLLDEQIAALGTICLADVDAAQHRLIQLAEQRRGGREMSAKEGRRAA